MTNIEILSKQDTLLTGVGIDTYGSHTFGHTDSEILGRLDGFHNAIHILFVIPEAVASINAHNTAIKAKLETLGRVDTITQADALTYPHFREYRLIVLGTNNGTAWTTTNLADIKLIDVAVVVVDATAAAYLAMGTDGGAAATKTAIKTVANIKGISLGIGRHGETGLAVGANTISASTTYSTLDMSNANITETWYAYEFTNDNTDVIIGLIYAEQTNGDAGIDINDDTIPATRAFYGAGYSFNDLNSLGQGVLTLLADTIFHETRSHISDITALQQKLLGNMTGSFGRTAPLVEYIAGQDSVGSKLPVGKSLYDTIVLDLLAGTETISSYNLPNDTAENTAITVTTAKRLRLDSIWLDLVNLVQDVTIKVYHKIDGTNYRQYDEFSWATAEEDGVLLKDITINGDWKLTITSPVAQGAIKAIPYNVIKTTMEA